MLGAVIFKSLRARKNVARKKNEKRRKKLRASCAQEKTCAQEKSCAQEKTCAQETRKDLARKCAQENCSKLARKLRATFLRASCAQLFLRASCAQVFWKKWSFFSNKKTPIFQNLPFKPVKKKPKKEHFLDLNRVQLAVHDWGQKNDLFWAFFWRFWTVNLEKIGVF